MFRDEGLLLCRDEQFSHKASRQELQPDQQRLRRTWSAIFGSQAPGHLHVQTPQEFTMQPTLLRADVHQAALSIRLEYQVNHSKSQSASLGPKNTDQCQMHELPPGDQGFVGLSCHCKVTVVVRKLSSAPMQSHVPASSKPCGCVLHHVHSSFAVFFTKSFL